jgi:hypothetical protein
VIAVWGGVGQAGAPPAIADRTWPSFLSVPDQLFGKPLVRDFAGGSRASFSRSGRRSIFHRRVGALLALIAQLPLRPEPVVLRIAGAAFPLPDLVRLLPDPPNPPILAGGDDCGRPDVRHNRLPLP